MDNKNDNPAEPVTSKPRKTKPQTVKIRAGSLQKLTKLEGEQKAWCEAVLVNNAPGQLVHADQAMLEACEKSSGNKVTRE